MKKIVCITGTRPQMVKHAVLIRSLNNAFNIETLHTGQHYQFELFDLFEKDLFANETFYRLRINKDLSPAKRLAMMIDGIADFLEVQQPDAVLVYGDTDTTLAGALAASKTNKCLIHIEAGERSFNATMPEESNRIVTDALSQILFCASQKGMQNLQLENNKNQIILSGDIMKDLLLQTAVELQNPLINENYIYCTIHRNYNKNNPEKLLQLLIVLSNLDCKVIFPVHPATWQTIQNLLNDNLRVQLKNIQFLDPLSYKQSIHYQKFSKAIITDSGGIQKEAYWLKRRCFTYRTETEWVDTLEGGWNKLVYEDINSLNELINTPLGIYNEDLYGNGLASTTITNHLLKLI